MATYVNERGIQQQIHLDLESAIKEWGEPLIDWRVLRLGEYLGDHYEVSRLEDGRLLFASQYGNIAGRSVLLTFEESACVLTDEEQVESMVSKEQEKTTIIKHMTLSDILPTGDGYGTAQAMTTAFRAAREGTLSGIDLLIVLLLAEKIEPREIWRMTNCSASSFLNRLERLKTSGIFSDWVGEIPTMGKRLA